MGVGRGRQAGRGTSTAPLVDAGAIEASVGGAAVVDAAVVLPVKAFRDAKVRLAPALDPAERAALARTMAAGVVAAAREIPVWVVCDDDEVADWARALGTEVLWMPERGLNRAVTEGVAALAAAGVRRAVVCHADLPHAHRLDHLLATGAGDNATVVLVPDRHRDGTNVLVVPSDAGFAFAYGPGSFDRHVAEAERLGLAVQVVNDPSLSWDVDRPDDLLAVVSAPDPDPVEPR
jgi:2-phospho-L-lactate/phosphoenolpyruvate guanylyltransferase